VGRDPSGAAARDAGAPGESERLEMKEAILLAAPIRTRLGKPLDALAPGDKKFCREQLAGVASIRDRAELLKQLPQYLEDLSQKAYDGYRRWHAELPPEAKLAGFYLLDQNERLKRVFVHDHAGRPEEVALVGWDVARVVHYATLVVGAGFLAEHEAWAVLAKAARLARAAYRSWSEYAAGVLYGRWFWVGYWEDGMVQTQKAIDTLSAGAWKEAAWEWDLAEIDAAAVGAAPVPTSVDETLIAIAVRMFVDCPACMSPVLVKEVGEELVCESCGTRSKEAERDAWGMGLGTLPDEDEDDEDEDDEEDEEKLEEELSTNLDDRIQRVVYRQNAPIPDGPRLPATEWMKEKQPRVRFVVGGPINLTGGFLTIVFGGEK
jgi:hypothetical protein